MLKKIRQSDAAWRDHQSRAFPRRAIYQPRNYLALQSILAQRISGDLLQFPIMTSTTPNATNDVTLSDAARRLGISLRTVQRRINKGDLETIERDGKRLVRLPGVIMTDSDRQPDAAILERLQAENEYLKRQIDAWRLQAEAANRTASETAAALRKVLEALPKELPPGADDAAQSDTANTSTSSINPTPHAAQQQPQNESDAQESAAAKSTFISRIIGRLARH